MASDNAVRQAVYEQTMMSTNDRGLALERAFEVINFRRAGSASIISIGRQTIPFFGAALQALSVQGRVISGRGITGTARAEGIQKFLTTAMTTSALTLLYAATMAGDEEYEKLDTSKGHNGCGLTYEATSDGYEDVWHIVDNKRPSFIVW